MIILVNLNPFKLVSEFDRTAMEIDQNAQRDAQLKQRQEDMVTTMSTELDKLFDNSNLFQKNGFQQLFTKFVSKEGQDSVEWDEIKKPPADSVGIILYCKVVDGMIFF